jgi:parvulin-like peptidyl-prolyl isomerase
VSAMLFSVILLLVLSVLPQERLADRVVAIVNDEPILLSELRQSLPQNILTTSSMRQLAESNLSALINQTLILQEVQRLKLFSVEQQELDAAMLEVEKQFASKESMEAELEKIGMTVEGLRVKLKRWILVRKFIDYRFRRYTEIDEDELQAFYESREWLAPLGLNIKGLPLPPLAQVRDQLLALLEERTINRELDAWLEAAREKARIVIKF